MTDQAHLREVVHDLKNRLSAIISAANAIRKSGYDREIGDEMIDIIRSNVEQADQTITELVESPSDAGR